MSRAQFLPLLLAALSPHAASLERVSQSARCVLIELRLVPAQSLANVALQDSLIGGKPRVGAIALSDSRRPPEFAW